MRMLKDLNSIKKIQSKTKDTLIEIKNNLQGNKSRVDEAENQINDLEHKEVKNKQQNKDKESKKTKQNKTPPTRILYAAPGPTSSILTFAS